MRLRAWLAVLILTACAPPPVPAPPRPVVTPAPPLPPPAPAPEPRPARRSRRGECDLDEAIDAFLMGQDAVRCGALTYRPAREDYERARACVLAAQRDRRAFTVSWEGPHIDSILRGAFVGRDLGDGYEIRWFAYDSCPSGCGTDDPSWSSARCEPLVDLREACAKLARNPKAPVDEEARWFCDEDGVHQHQAYALGLSCRGRTQPRGCGPDPE